MSWECDSYYSDIDDDYDIDYDPDITYDPDFDSSELCDPAVLENIATRGRVRKDPESEGLDEKNSKRNIRTGKTVRLSGSKHVHAHPDSDPSITTNHYMFIRNDDTHFEFPVSECDRAFPIFFDHLMKDMQRYRRYPRGCFHSDEFTPNKDNSWEIIDVLEKTHSEKQQYKEVAWMGNVNAVTVYKVPIIGSVVVESPPLSPSNTTQTINKNEIITYRGKGFVQHKSSIYYFSGKSFGDTLQYRYADIPKGFRPIHFVVKSSDSRKDCIPQRAKIRNGKRWNDTTKQLEDDPEYNYDNEWVNFWAPSDPHKKAYIVFDMLKNTKLEYISTMGRPVQTFKFPIRELNTGYTDRQYFFPITVTTDVNMHTDYVRRFTLEGRVDGGKWIHIGKFEGNNDRLTETLINIRQNIPDGFYPRYLKLTPTCVVGGGGIRVMLYAGAPNKSESEADVDTDKKLIEYTVKRDTGKKYAIKQGQTLFRRDEFYFATQIENKKKQKVLNIHLNEFVKNQSRDMFSIDADNFGDDVNTSDDAEDSDVEVFEFDENDVDAENNGDDEDYSTNLD